MVKAVLHLTLLGGYGTRLASGAPAAVPLRKAQALLAYLAVTGAGGAAASRERVAALLWGDRPDEQARASLRQALFMLRRAIGDDDGRVVIAEADRVQLDPARARSDVAEFERAVAELTPAALARAATLYRGDLLDGFALSETAFEDWVALERTRLRNLVLDALDRLAAHHAEREPEHAIEILDRLVEIDPLQEHAHRGLMRLHARLGRRAAALRQYETCAAALRRHLDVGPEPDTTHLRDAIRSGSVTGEPCPPSAGRDDGPAARTRRASRAGPGIEEDPLVGRNTEVSRLHAALDSAATTGRVMLILGEAGIGKSRLVRALGAEAERRHGRVLIGHCFEAARILPLGPWVEALRPVLADAAVRDGLGAAWRRRLVRLFPELATDERIDDDPLQLFEAISRLVERAAAVRPFVLVLEDLHWADEMSVRLIAFLGRRLASLPELLVLTARDDELDAVPLLRAVTGDLARSGRLERLVLTPLARHDTDALVGLLARRATPPVDRDAFTDAVWRVSEGNPFVVVEMMRAAHDGTLPSAGPLLPGRVREMTAARLDRLGERAREVLSVASVIGPSCSFGVLAQVTALDDDALETALDELVERRLLHDDGERIAFVHERIREVVYEAVLASRRRRLHAAVARALESEEAKQADERAAAAGFHHREARMWDEAARAFHRAGRGALARGAAREARTALEGAIAALAQRPETPERLAHGVELRLDVCATLVTLGSVARVRDIVEEADAMATRLGDRRQRAWIACYRAGYHHYYAARYAEADAEAARALELMGNDAPPELIFRANYQRANACNRLGDFRRAIAFAAESVRAIGEALLGERFNLMFLPSVFGRTVQAASLCEVGEVETARALTAEAIVIAERFDHALSRASAYFAEGAARLRGGDADSALSWLERGWDLSTRMEFHGVAAVGSVALAEALVATGRADEAVQLLERVRGSEGARGAGYVVSRLTIELGRAYQALGRRDDARRMAGAALALTRERGERAHEAHALALLGDVERDPAHHAAAAEIARHLEMAPLLARCRQALTVR